MCVFSDANKQLAQFGHYLTLSPGQIPQGKGSVPQDCPSPPPPRSHQTPITSQGCHLCFSPSGYRLEVPTTPSLGSAHLLERLTEPTETVYLLDYWFTIKRRNSGAARWKRGIGQRMGRGLGVSTRSWATTLPASPRAHPPHSSLNGSFCVFMAASWHRHAWLNHWPLGTDSTSSLSPHPRSSEGWGWRLQPSKHLVASPGNQRPSVGAFQKPPH